MLDAVKNVFFSSTLRVFLVFLLLVTSGTIFAVLPFKFVINWEVRLIMVLNAIIFFHHWFGMFL